MPLVTCPFLMSKSQSNLLVYLSFATFIIMSIPSGMLGVAWPSMQETFGVSLDALGTLLLVGTIGHISMSFLSGWLNERLGMGTYMLLNSILMLLGLLGYAFSPSWWLLVAVGLIGGAGTGALDSGLNAYFAANHNARLMNWLHASFGLGVTMGPIIMTAVLTRNSSWRIGYWVAVGLQLLLVLLFATTRHRWPRAVVAREGELEGGETAVSASAIFRMGIIWLSMGVFFFTAGTEGAMGNWAFTLFSEGRGVAVATAGLWTSVYWGSFTVGRIFYGLFADRMETNQLLRLNMIAIVVGALFIWLNLANWLSFVGLVVVGFALAPIFPLLVLQTPKRISARFANSAVGFQVGAAGLGLSILPAITGIVGERFGLEAIGLSLLLWSLLLMGLHEWIIGHVRRKRKEKTAVLE